MDQQEESMDFKTVRAMFEEKEYLLRQPKARPVVSTKPKAAPSPQSPTYLPAGARPSLLTSMNQALEGNAVNVPRVVFKDEKKEAKKPLIQTNVKGKEKSDGKVKESKSKMGRESKKHEEKQEDASYQKDKKLPSFIAKKEVTAELVPISPPPKVQKKKGFPVFKKSAKRESAIIIDSPTLEGSGPAPLIPVPSDAGNMPDESIYSIPKSILLKENPLADMTPPSHTPEPPDVFPPPVFFPEVPTPQIETPSDTENPALPVFSTISQNKIPNTPSVVPSPPNIAAPTPSSTAAPSRPNTAIPSRPSFAPPAPPNSAVPSHPNIAPQAPLPVAAPIAPNIVAPNLSATAVLDPSPSAAPAPLNTASLTPPRRASPAPLLSPSPSASPTPPTRLAFSEALPVASAPSPSPPELQVTAEFDSEDVDLAVAAEERPLTPDSPSSSQYSKIERPISALSALERAEDMSSGKRTPPSDLRILNALEKARKKAASPLLNSNRSYSVTPPPEDPPFLEIPTDPLPELPPIDYNGENLSTPKSAMAQFMAVNGTDHQQDSPNWEHINEEGSDGVPELLVVPPPPLSQALPEDMSLYSSPAKPDRPPSVSLSQNEFIPPPPLFEEMPVPSEFLEAETEDVPELEGLASDANSPEVPVVEWDNKNYKGADAADGRAPLEYYSNGVTDPETEAHSEPEYEDSYKDSAVPESSLPVSLPVTQDPPPVEEPQVDFKNSAFEDTENMYEDVATSVSKKKGKSNNDKKRKGTPKNPYTDSSQETALEKTKTGRFSKIEKKVKEDEKNEKELKKKEKQRLEKEKKEMKEKMEREKKEQKEKEKKENEMKKKFKITGQEEVLYQAKVTETTKGRKHNLPVKSGDIVNIIRTDFCPKGKWLARDSSNNYGYIDVQHVELDIKEMLELGKKAGRTSAVIDLKDTNAGNSASNHLPGEAYTDDSEEWNSDEDEPHSPSPTGHQFPPAVHSKTLSMPDMGNTELPINHQQSRSDMCDNSQSQARKEALQKLEIFLQSPKPANPTPSDPEPETSPAPEQKEEVSVPEESATQEEDFDPAALILPPPPDFMV
ncbi:nascent polypeptide-associated complex subunit alpha, muscle-specific form isoform X2 [Kryptolebias marmoratus]|uniref:Nascent polypeptide-associated complex subunit alpha, muscle-specific form-like n=1 Tax=Kryptolebias marmoratus TaxID=37003 RepID=A0A3Q2ZMD9_KRYMA|nr:nascent polypeptide-associated complex subunit alpha, muscle-specific form isoform X2 [Kryptolebias marmoratus]